MAFCPRCGTALCGDEIFCRNCGSKIAPTVSARPGSKGRGFAIAGLILGILGLATSAVFFFACAMPLEPDSYLWTGLSVVFVLYFPFNLLALFFGAKARKRGYQGKLSKRGMLLGCIGAAVYVTAWLIPFVKLITI